MAIITVALKSLQTQLLTVLSVIIQHQMLATGKEHNTATPDFFLLPKQYLDITSSEFLIMEIIMICQL